MATKTKTLHITFIGFLLLISLFHSLSNSQVSARRNHTRRSHHHHHNLKAKKSLHSPVSSSCASPPLPQGALKISHRYGPCSPLGQQQEKHNKGNSYSNAAAAAANSTVVASNYVIDSSNHGEGVVVSTFGRSLGHGNWVVTVGLGTPNRDLNLMVDTGSDVSWVDCQSGENDDNRFDPNISSTFSREVHCDPDPAPCPYDVTYRDGSESRGYYVQDKLTIFSTDEFPRFIFGCSLQKTGDFGQTAGMLALGHSSVVSFVKQTAEKYLQIFCYCLPTRRAKNGYLLFGREAVKQCRTSNKFTPLLRNPQDSPYQYFVNFNGITISGTTVNLPASSSSAPGTIIDSGTEFTSLPAAVFEEVRAEFVKSMGGYYPVAPAAGEVPELDTCYNMQGNYRDDMIPEVVLHFEGLDVSLSPSGVVWLEDVGGASKVCLAFVGQGNDEKDLTIFGNHQQRGLNVLHDIQGSRVEIGPGNCGD